MIHKVYSTVYQNRSYSQKRFMNKWSVVHYWMSKNSTYWISLYVDTTHRYCHTCIFEGINLFKYYYDQFISKIQQHNFFESLNRKSIYLFFHVFGIQSVECTRLNLVTHVTLCTTIIIYPTIYKKNQVFHTRHTYYYEYYHFRSR